MTAIACGRTAPESSAPRAEQPRQPRRVAAEAENLRLMIAEIMTSRACAQLSEMLRPIGGDGEGPVSGVMWIQECEARGDGTNVTLQLAGRGWQWVSRSTETAGAEFGVDDYVRFKFSVEVRGSVDVAYAPEASVFTLWFTPTGEPDATFEPLGEVEVDTEGLWSSVVGGIASAVGPSPETRAGKKVSKTGRRALEEEFARGIAVTIDLCSGNVRSGFGHPEAGEMLGPAPAVGREEAIVQPRGLLLRGPLVIPPGGIELEVMRGGPVVSQLVCADEATKLAKQFLEGGVTSDVKTVTSQEVRRRAVVRAPEGTSCPLVHVIRPAGTPAGEIRMRYSVSELTARLSPLVRCDRDRK